MNSTRNDVPTRGLCARTCVVGGALNLGGWVQNDVRQRPVRSSNRRIPRLRTSTRNNLVLRPDTHRRGRCACATNIRVQGCPRTIRRIRVTRQGRS